MHTFKDIHHASRLTIGMLCAIALLHVACASEDATSTAPETTADAGDAGGTHDASEDTSADASSGTPVLFMDDFEGLGPPFVEGYDGLPEALFDAARWTQLQNDPDGTNRAEWIPSRGGGAMRFVAFGQPDGVASKMDLGRGIGFEFRIGDVVLLGADVFVEGDAAILPDNTLIDLEDTDDLMLGDRFAGAGLRVRTNGSGRLVLDRGELVGSDLGEPAHFVLESMNSAYVLPVGQWVRIEAVVKLGVGVGINVDGGVVDASFDADTTDAWCELWVQPEGEERRLVMRQRGTTFLDRDVGVDLLARDAPDTVFVWPEGLDYNSVQAGLTNNRSTVDQRLLLDNVRIERLGP